MNKITSYPVVIGLVLKDLRTNKQLTQGHFARKMHMTSAGWAKLERGLSTLSMDKFALASDLLDLKPSEILKIVDDQVAKLIELGWFVESKRVKGDLLSEGAEFVAKMAGSSTLKWQGMAAGKVMTSAAATGAACSGVTSAPLASTAVGGVFGIGAIIGAAAAAASVISTSNTCSEQQDKLVFVIKLALEGVTHLEKLQNSDNVSDSRENSKPC